MLLRPIMIVLCSALLLNAKSTIQIPYKKCAKYPYANLIGGTMHSRFVQKKMLLKEATLLARFSEKEALLKIQERYPELNIQALSLSIKNCFVYFKATSDDKRYYFDAGTLVLQKGEKK